MLLTDHTSFEFRNALLGQTMPTLFGWWAVQPPPAAPDALAFALSPTAPFPADEPIWAIGLISNQPFQADDYVAILSSGRDEASHWAAQIWHSLQQTGPQCGVPLTVETPGLMNGLAGIGYGLLRLVTPLPSILLLQPPN